MAALARDAGGFTLATDYRTAIAGGGLAKPRLVRGAALGVFVVKSGAQSPARLSQGLHISLLWMILLAAGTELFWFVDALPGEWMPGVSACRWRLAA
jgi:hypothetical protein